MNPISETIEQLRAERANLDELIAGLERHVEKHANAGERTGAPRAKSRPPTKGRKRKPGKIGALASSTLGKTAPGNHPEIAKWRKEILAPMLQCDERSEERCKARDALIGTKVERLDGTMQTLTRGTIYMWLRLLEGRG